MNKLEMAQEYIVSEIRRVGVCSIDLEKITESWNIADAMQAESDKREKQKAIDDAESSKVFFEKLTDIPDQYSGPEWQPDWSLAPESYNQFCVGMDSGWGFFTNIEPELIADEYFFVGGEAQVIKNHGYTGDWRDSVRKRPNKEPK